MTDFRYTPDNIKLIRRHALTMSPATIATLMHAPLSTIEKICREQGILTHGRDIGAMSDPAEHDSVDASHQAEAVMKPVRILVDEPMLLVIKKEARQRGLNGNALIERLIEKIAKNRLFSVILDR
jgi:hypothetical protein